MTHKLQEFKTPITVYSSFETAQYSAQKQFEKTNKYLHPKRKKVPLPGTQEVYLGLSKPGSHLC